MSIDDRLVLKLQGFVNADPEFEEHPQVVNGGGTSVRTSKIPTRMNAAEHGAKHFEDLTIGDTAERTFVISPEMVQQFAAFTGDDNPSHQDETYARRLGLDAPSVHGMLYVSLVSGILYWSWAVVGVRWLATARARIDVHLSVDPLRPRSACRGYARRPRERNWARPVQWHHHAAHRVPRRWGACDGRRSQDGSSSPISMRRHLALAAVVVRDYDEAIAFYTRTLGFDLIEDTFLPDEDKRWVVVGTPGAPGTRLLLARAVGDHQESRVGDQTGGRVAFFLHTDDFWRDYRKYRENGVVFVREPKVANYGTVAVFQDLYGNLWDLLEPRTEES